MEQMCLFGLPGNILSGGQRADTHGYRYVMIFTGGRAPPGLLVSAIVKMAGKNRYVILITSK